MKAIIKATEKAGSLEIAEMEDPMPDIDEVLVKIKAAGICGSDLLILDNKYIGRKPIPIPLIMGHEGAGEIVELGKRVTGFRIGDRVALEAIHGCGFCYQCKSGFKNMCEDWSHIGITRPGVFAEYIAIPVSQVHKISDSISFLEAALAEPLGLAVRSVEQSRPMIGEIVAILGPGSLGLMHALAYKAAGVAKIIMIGKKEDEKRLKKALELGVDNIINMDEQNYLETVLNITNGLGADIVVETANSPEATKMSFDIAAPRGRIVLFGLYPEAKFDQIKLLRKRLTVYGDVGQLSSHFLCAIKWIETSKVEVNKVIEKIYGLDEAKKAFQALQKREVIKVMFEL